MAGRGRAKKSRAKKTAKKVRKKLKLKSKKKATVKKPKVSKKSVSKRIKRTSKTKSRKKSSSKLSRPSQSMVFDPLEQVTVICSNCGRNFSIVKLRGLGTEGMICQRCTVGEIDFPE